jgi:hypothetical protein
MWIEAIHKGLTSEKGSSKPRVPPSR